MTTFLNLLILIAMICQGYTLHQDRNAISTITNAEFGQRSLSFLDRY
jgi:hypothetical protein